MCQKSGAGKTALLERLIAGLKRRGYPVGAMKHDAHQLNIDREGKNLWRLIQAGAHTMIIRFPAKIAMITQNTNLTEPGVSRDGQYLSDSIHPFLRTYP